MNGPLSASANERRQMPTVARASRQPQTSRNFPCFDAKRGAKFESPFKSGRSEPLLSRRSVALFVPGGPKPESQKSTYPLPFSVGGSIT